MRSPALHHLLLMLATDEAERCARRRRCSAAWRWTLRRDPFTEGFQVRRADGGRSLRPSPSFVVREGKGDPPLVRVRGSSPVLSRSSSKTRPPCAPDNRHRQQPSREATARHPERHPGTASGRPKSGRRPCPCACPFHGHARQPWLVPRHRSLQSASREHVTPASCEPGFQGGSRPPLRRLGWVAEGCYSLPVELARSGGMGWADLGDALSQATDLKGTRPPTPRQLAKGCSATDLGLNVVGRDWILGTPGGSAATVASFSWTARFDHLMLKAAQDAMGGGRIRLGK